MLAECLSIGLGYAVRLEDVDSGYALFGDVVAWIVRSFHDSII